jgi:hypothetical protein
MVRRGVQKIPPKNRLRGVFEIHAFLPKFHFSLSQKTGAMVRVFWQKPFFLKKKS